MGVTPGKAEVDAYIKAAAKEVRPVLEEVREAIAAAVPDARQTISYKMPAFMLDGVFIYFAAFKHHIGIYPPVRQDKALLKTLAPFCGEKGNLRFPLNQPMPLALIARVAKTLAREHAGRKKERV